MSINLAEIELGSVQNIKTSETQTLVKHRIPGLEGDIIQQFGRYPATIFFEGVFNGEEALSSIEKLRNTFKTHEPVFFVADITGSTDVTEVVIRDLHIWEVGGKPNHFAYAIWLEEYVEVIEEDVAVEIEEAQEREAEEVQEKKENQIEDGVFTLEVELELQDADAEYTDFRLLVYDSEGELIETVDKETDGVFSAEDIPQGMYRASVEKRGEKV